MLNYSAIQGRLTRDCELKKYESGTSFTSGTIACQRNFKNKDGNYDTDFIKFSASGKTAELMCRRLHKGSMVIIEGEIRPRSYTTKDGKEKDIDEVIVRQIQFCDNKGKEESTEAEENEGTFDELPDPDDLPF